MFFFKKLIPNKIKDLFWKYFKKIYYPFYNRNFNFYKKHRYKLFNLNFFSPKTIENKNLFKVIENEKKDIELIHKIFLKPTTYIDIGANIGYWTFARNHILNDNINFYCFEPSHLNFSYLHKNLDRFENIKIIHCGLSNKSEIKTLSFPYWEREGRKKNTGLLSLHGNTNTNAEKVKLITLDNYFKDLDICGNIYIKIDVEGHEFQVLQGSQFFLSQNLDIIVQLELNPRTEDALNNNNIQNSINILTDLNYEPNVISNSQIKLLLKDELKKIISNKINMELYFTKKNH